MKNYYLIYKAQGLCSECGAEPLPQKTRCSRCHERQKEYGRAFRERSKLKGLCLLCCKSPKAENRSTCVPCAKKSAVISEKMHQRRRQQCITNYGGSCVCCGCTAAKYLQLDHVNNDGADHRRKLSKNNRNRGRSLYQWAIKNNYPKLLQLMCANCHQAKTSGSECTEEDHELSRMIHEVPLIAKDEKNRKKSGPQPLY